MCGFVTWLTDWGTCVTDCDRACVGCAGSLWGWELRECELFALDRFDCLAMGTVSGSRALLSTALVSVIFFSQTCFNSCSTCSSTPSSKKASRTLFNTSSMTARYSLGWFRWKWVLNLIKVMWAIVQSVHTVQSVQFDKVPICLIMLNKHIFYIV